MPNDYTVDAHLYLRSGNGGMGGVTPMGTARSRSRAATVGGKVYVMGGHDEGRNTFNVVECFDPATGTWEVVAPMGTARCSFGAAIRLLRLVCLLAPFGPDYPSTTGSGEHCIQQPECCSYAVDETGQVCAYVSFPPSLALVSDPCCLSSFQPARTHTQ